MTNGFMNARRLVIYKENDAHCCYNSTAVGRAGEPAQTEVPIAQRHHLAPRLISHKLE